MLHQKQVDAICSEVINHLHEKRLKMGLSMNAVAERGGLSQQMVSYVERGMRKPTLDTIIRMACALDVDLVPILEHFRRASVVSKKQRPRN